jgi:MATE family multidrug resistance protein
MYSNSSYSKLLQEPAFVDSEYGSVQHVEPDTSSQQAEHNTISTELSMISRSSVSLIITFFLQYSLTVVSIFSVGHIGKTELAAVSLSSMTFNITASVFNGVATCLDTLCSQAYGAGKFDLVGLHFQRCTCMVFFIAIPINIIWWCSGSILQQFVPNKELTELAQMYLKIISFGSPGYILFETGKRFLQA